MSGLDVLASSLRAKNRRGHMGSLDSYLPIFFMIVLGIAFAGLSFAASRLLAPQRPTSAKRRRTSAASCPTTSRRGASPCAST